MIRSGVLGHGIGYTLSPAIHEAVGRALGLELTYDVLDTIDGHTPVELLLRARDAGYAGINVTYPHKRAVLEAMDELADSAQVMDAVNTVVFTTDGRMVGHNTDAAGFGDSLDDLAGDITGHRVVQVGAGGAGRATATALAARGVSRILLHDPADGVADALATLLSGHEAAPAFEIVAAADLADAVRGADGIVNASPVGSRRVPGSAVPLAALRAEHWVSDVVYAPAVTELVGAARAAGARAVNGGPMLVGQAALSFELFHGVRPDRARMWRHFASIEKDAA